MSLVRSFGLLAVFGLLGAGGVIAACGSGDAGVKGDPGTTGAPGVAGPAGAQGLPGNVADGGGALSKACTVPCHTFGGVVDQWRFSNHSHPQNSEIGGGSCGNCHGIDGLQQRVANNFVVGADAGPATNIEKGHLSYNTASGAVAEIGYGGATTIGRIHCSTCHDFNATNDPHVTGQYVAGQAPLRVAGGVGDTAFLEKSEGSPPIASTGQSVAYRTANLCVFCHKSRKDVSLYVTASNTLSSFRWGPHEGPQSDVYSGKGGYHFAAGGPFPTAPTYGSSAHASLANACVSCHMGPVATNGDVPDHTMKPKVAFCKGCHTEYTGKTFDIQGGQTLVANALLELQAALNAAGLLTRAEVAPFPGLSPDDLADRQFNLDRVRPGSGVGGTNQVVNAATGGALYNYLIIARSKDFGVHNPTYAKQLLWDSIRVIKGANPTSLPARPN